MDAAAYLDSLRSMVMGFNLSELQELMFFARRSQSGRLEDLRRSALDLLRNNDRLPIHIQIRRLHCLRHPFPPMVSPAQLEMRPAFEGPFCTFGASAGPFVTHPQLNSARNSGLFIPPAVSSFHGTPVGAAIPRPSWYAPPSNEKFYQPEEPRLSGVRFKQSPLYEVLAELLQPTTVVPVPGRKEKGWIKTQEVKYLINLTPEQAQDVLNSKSCWEPNEFQTQIHLRCCLVNTSCEQDDDFPVNIWVKINRTPCPLPKPIVVPGAGPRRLSQPLEITSLVNLTPDNQFSNPASPLTVVNELIVRWYTKEMAKYAVAVYLVRKRTAGEMLQFGSRSSSWFV